MKQVCWVLLIIALLAALCRPEQVQAAASDKPGQDNLITMNFQDVDIAVLAKFISDITGKNFVLDQSVRGKVSIISPTKVTPQQAYSIFKSVLQLKGFTTVQAGPVIKIQPARTVRESAQLTQSQQPALTSSDEYVTRMIKLRNIDASSLVNVIQPMISRDGLVAAYPETNTLIVTDDAWNVQRLLKIIGSLDAQGLQESVAVIPLKLAYADDLAPKIEEIMSSRAGGSSNHRMIRRGAGVVAPSAEAPSRAFKIVPDERTNSLVVLAGPLQMRQIKDLVARLDVHSPSATSRIHVYYLKYAQALEMVEVLNSLLGGGGTPAMLTPQTGRGSLGRSSGIGLGGFGALGSVGGYGGYGGGQYGGYGGGYRGYGGYGGGYGGSFGGLGGGMNVMAGRGENRGGSANKAPASATSTGGPGTEFENPVRVTADPATNSLVISAMPQDYATLRKIISELDIPRRQVFVQAVLAEVSTARMRQLGISFQGATGIGNTLGVANFNFGNLATSLANPLGLTGLNFGLASGSMCTVTSALGAASSLAGFGTTTSTTGSTSITIPCDVALISAIENDTHSNILSAPTLLTSDNEEATIVVGQNIPILAGATATSALSGQIFSSVDRQNVGITLDIVPQITAGGYVRMDVYVEVSAVEGNTQNTATNPLGPTTTIRAASTTVLVQNHRTTVIGGLLSDQVENQRNGVPFLSDIPVVGNLFTSRSRTGQKTDLLLFLTPHVIRNRQDLRELSLYRRQKFLQSLGRKELHNMPMAQVQQLYKPSFGLTVTPGEELGGPVPGASAPAGSGGQPYSPPPLNTEEINPPPSGASLGPTSSGKAPAGSKATSGSSATSSHKGGGVMDAASGLYQSH